MNAVFDVELIQSTENIRGQGHAPIDFLFIFSECRWIYFNK